MPGPTKNPLYLLSTAAEIMTRRPPPTPKPRRLTTKQIMDPKMDSGYVSPGDTFAPDFDVCSYLAPQEVVWIMDELLRLEILFHNGYPLSQTIFTSLHIDRLIEPDNRGSTLCNEKLTGHASSLKQGKGLVHVVLQAYCLAVIKSCELALNAVQSQVYYEEEDFTTALFGRELCPKVTVDHAMNSLVQAMDWIDDSKLEKQLKHALKHRLVVREQLLYALGEPVNGPSHNWVRLKRQIQRLQEKDMQLGIPAPATFSDKVQRKLATSTPPRESPALPLEASLKQWIQMCDDIVAVRSLTSDEVRSDSSRLQRAAWIFGYRSPRPSTYARAKMQEIIFSGRMSLDELIYDELRLLVLAGHPGADDAIFKVEVASDPRFRLARLIQEFITSAMPLYENMFRLLCQNTSRKRRMCSDAIRQWWELEKSSTAADIEFWRISQTLCSKKRNTSPFSQWGEVYRLKHCMWFVQLGFETDVYLPGEMEVMFRSLHFLSQNLESIVKSFRARHEDIFGDSAPPEASESRDVIERLAAEINITLEMTSCMCLLWSFLGLTKIIRNGTNTYTQSQYEARMKPLLEIGMGIIPTLEQIRMGTGQLQHFSHGTAAGFSKEHTRLRQSVLGTALKRMQDLDQKLGVPSMGASQKQFNTKAMQTMVVAMGAEVGRLAQVCKDHGKEIELTPDLGDIIQVDLKGAQGQYHVWWPVPHFTVKRCG